LSNITFFLLYSKFLKPCFASFYVRCYSILLHRFSLPFLIHMGE